MSSVTETIHRRRAEIRSRIAAAARGVPQSGEVDIDLRGPRIRGGALPSEGDVIPYEIRVMRARRVIAAVAEAFGSSAEEIRGGGGKQRVQRARRLAVLAASRATDLSGSDIAPLIGRDSPSGMAMLIRGAENELGHRIRGAALQAQLAEAIISAGIDEDSTNRALNSLGGGD